MKEMIDEPLMANDFSSIIDISRQIRYLTDRGSEQEMPKEVVVEMRISDEFHEYDTTIDEDYSRSTESSEGYRYRSVHPFWIPTKRKLSSSGGAKVHATELIQNNRQKLPAWKSRESFLDTISAHRAMVVTGETGCGKTTQIPQFLFELDPEAKIVVCQVSEVVFCAADGNQKSS